MSNFKHIYPDASVHPATLENMPEQPVKRRRKRTPAKPVPAITSTQVNPGIWAAALKLASGDWKRIEVISPTKVIVHDENLR